MAETIIEFISILLTVAYLVIVISFIRGWNRLERPAPPKKGFSTRVSVLIAARDEEKAIGRCLEAVIAQHYPPELLEVIVIDDHSTDRTAEMVRSFQQPGLQPELRLITMNEHKPINSYKKKAIAQAIQVAKGELIVTTDADCWMGPQWLAAIVSAYEEHGYKLISSPVAFSEENSLFERLQSLEFMYLIGLGASAIGNAFPSTCNGANLAYTREVFFQVEGFKGIDDLASGDDELLLHKVAALYYNKIGFVKSRQAIVYTHAKANLREFLDQRKRWASKSIKYRNKLVVALGLSVYFFNVFILLNACLTLFNFNFAVPLLGMLGLKILVEIVFLYFLAGFFRRLPLLVWMPLLNLLHVVYMSYIGLAGQRRSYRWKGRQVK
ncbi:cellulose synthase/poly-beta-1,6-N-acetylglucosamine synthase-like glycosyltransferase [Anseongella ginsenosidimutans]|uniref:Cellulose synthase/poly-beta-1,6-N-acetylglucosamine synthase-like glycosyltransferase n=1 Tax=Anseongella ginsenosidimutans TaxID=496056 RepID=A0A4V2UTL9_9SPHI|nr:glycosyltransferase [Anseongella ginsenosidimutans]QEC52213.1 glycosyltransferase [Anseongella ginsenosidimutans]TCS86762.1 cellulose synthase/poly-beta-1,6-N-acetylglucosamine synthase-like glycosyltransferase [Anseongella ginsenosidimutans]